MIINLSNSNSKPQNLKNESLFKHFYTVKFAFFLVFFEH